MGNNMAWSIDIESGRLSGPSGYHHYLVVQPERRRVYVFVCVGSGTPMDVWHRRATTLRLPLDVDGEQVASVLRSHTEELDKIAAAYLGERWDGRDSVGRWDEGADYRDAEADIERDLEELPTYWDAGDWIRPDSGYTLRYSVREAAQALSEGRSLSEWAETVCADNADDALVDPEELEDAIKREVMDDPTLLIDKDTPGTLVAGAELLAAEVGVDCPDPGADGEGDE